MPLASKSQGAPPSDGNQITGRPQCPCTAISAEPPSDGAIHPVVLGARHAHDSFQIRRTRPLVQGTDQVVERREPGVPPADHGVRIGHQPERRPGGAAGASAAAIASLLTRFSSIVPQVISTGTGRGAVSVDRSGPELISRTAAHTWSKCE